MSRCTCDGTFLFFGKVAEEVLNKVMTGSTRNINILSDELLEEINKNPIKWFKHHHIRYTIGNIVLASEYDDKFATKEKPWMTARFSAFLPIKFEIVEV